jgi:hypothetical protein
METIPGRPNSNSAQQSSNPAQQIPNSRQREPNQPFRRRSRLFNGLSHESTWRPPVSLSRGVQQTVEVKQRGVARAASFASAEEPDHDDRSTIQIILNIARYCRVFSSKTLTPEEAADSAFDLRALARR